MSLKHELEVLQQSIQPYISFIGSDIYLTDTYASEPKKLPTAVEHSNKNDFEEFKVPSYEAGRNKITRTFISSIFVRKSNTKLVRVFRKFAHKMSEIHHHIAVAERDAYNNCKWVDIVRKTSII